MLQFNQRKLTALKDILTTKKIPVYQAEGVTVELVAEIERH